MKSRSRPAATSRVFEVLLPGSADDLASQIAYGGNPELKRSPGDFSLDPPSRPRSDKGHCDDIGVFRRADATALLREAARRGIVSRARGAGGRFPKQIWGMTSDGSAVEAILENPDSGAYHGYPLHPDDPFARRLAQLWRERAPVTAPGSGEG
ncbi:hypothetical protein [Salinarimonas chemoclinalis]|uniref:hypothetical protein n=1 Tax=Salinarimonas chemoclinalis TaxID=3241599 RepID=UPI00355746F8